MSIINSPFFSIQDFFSPSLCDQIIDEMGLSAPAYEADDKTPIKHERIIKGTRFEGLLKKSILDNAEAIQARYGGSLVGMDEPHFFQFFENPKVHCVAHGCENSKFLKRKWVVVKDVDLVGYVWLKDYNDGIPLDPSFEVYGGKLEFPAYDFSIIPERGSAVIFPAGPHFITAVSHVFVGSMEYIKFALKLVRDTETGEAAWFYQPENFPGTYQDWFNQPETN